MSTLTLKKLINTLLERGLTGKTVASTRQGLVQFYNDCFEFWISLQAGRDKKTGPRREVSAKTCSIIETCRVGWDFPAEA
jgi:hypothetical protein